MLNESADFEWGGSSGQLIDKDWSTGDQIWKIGDCVYDPEITGGIGIVCGIASRRRAKSFSDERIVRFTYAISSA